MKRTQGLSKTLKRAGAVVAGAAVGIAAMAGPVSAAPTDEEPTTTQVQLVAPSLVEWTRTDTAVIETVTPTHLKASDAKTDDGQTDTANTEDTAESDATTIDEPDVSDAGEASLDDPVEDSLGDGDAVEPEGLTGQADGTLDELEDELTLDDPCLGAERTFGGGTGNELTDRLCGDGEGEQSSGGGASGPPGRDSYGGTTDPTDGLGNPDPLDNLCAGVQVRPSGSGPGLDTVTDDPFSWTTSLGRGIADFMENGFDGEEDAKGVQLSRIITSPVWVGPAVVGSFVVENFVNAATNPLGVHPLTDPANSEKINEGLRRADERAHSIGDDETDDDSDDGEAEGDSGADGSDGGDGSGGSGEAGPDGTTEPAFGDEESGNGVEKLCREMRERRGEDPHGRDEQTYAGTDCDDPTTNPATEDETGLDTDSGPEVEVSCDPGTDPTATGPGGDCGELAQPAAGETGCGTSPEADHTVGRGGAEVRDLPAGLSFCNPVLCQPLADALAGLQTR